MFVHKLVLSSAPVLTPEDLLTTIAYMRTRPGFKGVIATTEGVGYTLWETEEDANSFTPYNGKVNDLIVSVEVMPLEESGKVQADFFEFLVN